MSTVDTRPVPVTLLRWPRTRDLITQHKCILMYLWAHPEMTACGVYLLPIDATAADLSMTPSSLVDALREFERRGLIDLDHETGEVMIVEWFRWYTPRTAAARGAVDAAIRKIRSTKLVQKTKSLYESMATARKEKEKEKEKETPVVTPPSVATSDAGEKNPPNPPKGGTGFGKTPVDKLVAIPPPAGLDMDAWQRWVQYRREIRRPIKPASVPAAQRKLASFGTEQAAVVEQSVANGWQGLFPVKAAAHAATAQQQDKTCCVCGQPGVMMRGGKWYCGAHMARTRHDAPGSTISSGIGVGITTREKIDSTQSWAVPEASVGIRRASHG